MTTEFCSLICLIRIRFAINYVLSYKCCLWKEEKKVGSGLQIVKISIKISHRRNANRFLL